MELWGGSARPCGLPSEFSVSPSEIACMGASGQPAADAVAAAAGCSVRSPERPTLADAEVTKFFEENPFCATRGEHGERGDSASVPR